MTEIILTTLAGFLAHRGKRYTDRFPDGWRELANYSIGVAAVLPFVGLTWRGLRGVKGEAKRGALAYLLAFFSFGAGVAAGWVADTLKGEGK